MIDPAPIYDAATAFWKSSVLFAACRVGVFDALTDPSDAEGVAKRLDLSQRGALALLDACVALDLLEKKEGQYHNTPTSERYLTSESPASLLVTLELQAKTYPMWMNLSESVKKGQPTIPPRDLLGGDPELTEQFVVGMHQRALGIAESLVNVIDLSGCRLLADIGGGPGTYSTMILKRYPELRSRIFDLAPIQDVARTLVATSGVDDRIEMVPCDATKDDFGNGNDAVLISGLLHRMTPETSQDILRKAYQGMESGGQLILNDLFTLDGEPALAVLFGLQFLLTNETGGTHDARDMAAWASDAGFVDIETISLFPYMVITARKA
ncbi:MAG: hypothetical protein KJO21_11870 [Verrucomicrobiae bacterium]|nr:hypothetical protein [Verrucomicrobiae bacterium]NNJ43918.1 hypothetical protein [Akkermansiaceae bacterium]